MAISNGGSRWAPPYDPLRDIFITLVLAAVLTGVGIMWAFSPRCQGMDCITSTALRILAVGLIVPPLSAFTVCFAMRSTSQVAVFSALFIYVLYALLAMVAIIL